MMIRFIKLFEYFAHNFTFDGGISKQEETKVVRD